MEHLKKIDDKEKEIILSMKYDSRFKPFLKKMLSEDYSFEDIRRFEKMFNCYLKEGTGLINWDSVIPLEIGTRDIVDYRSLAKVEEEEVKSLKDRIVVVKLNGGIGTGMGCSGPKSIINVKKKESFLKIIVDQIYAINKRYGVSIPLSLFNSAATYDETRASINKMERASDIDISYLQQKLFPRISIEKDSSGGKIPLPVDDSFANEAYYPLGHGDIFPVLKESGVLLSFRDQGKDYLFISNSDNPGAVPDEKILRYLIDNRVDFLMEVALRTENDTKGGTPIRYSDGDSVGMKLLEIAQVPQ